MKAFVKLAASAALVISAMHVQAAEPTPNQAGSTFKMFTMSTWFSWLSSVDRSGL